MKTNDPIDEPMTERTRALAALASRGPLVRWGRAGEPDRDPRAIRGGDPHFDAPGSLRPAPRRPMRRFGIGARLCVHVALLSMASACSTLSSARAVCTHWAAPAASIRGDSAQTPLGTRESPFRIADFWAIASPGQTLCLLDGEYTAPADMIRPPPGLSGSKGSPITIRALRDGAVLIDGGARRGSKIRSPVRLKNNDYFVLEGFNAANGNTNVIGIGGSWDNAYINTGLGPAHRKPIKGVVLRRIIAWDANPRFAEYRECVADPRCRKKMEKERFVANFHVFDIAAAEDILVEDSAAFGTGRKVMQVFLSENVTLRRVWARWEGNAATHTQTISCAYRSYSSLCENVIAGWSAEQQPEDIDISQQLKTVLGMDWFKRSDSWQRTEDPFDAGLRVLGSFAYVAPHARLQPASVVAYGYGKGQELTDVVAFTPQDFDARYIVALVRCEGRADCSWQEGRSRTEAPLSVRGLTLISRKSRSAIDPEWSQGGSFTPPRRINLGAIRTGVLSQGTDFPLCYRYVDGKATHIPLWPWPMEERIKDATRMARGKATSIEAEVASMLGPIPPICRSLPARPAGMH